MSENYEVGYSKPPKRGQFQKGQSGNPKGRPKGRRNKGSVVRQVIDRKVAIRENGKTRKVTVFEALVESMVSKALTGSINDQIKLIQLIEKHAPEKLEDIQDDHHEVIVTYVMPDGHGRPADRALWEDWQWESYAKQVARRNQEPDMIAAWKAAGFDDEDEPEANSASYGQ